MDAEDNEGVSRKDFEMDLYMIKAMDRVNKMELKQSRLNGGSLQKRIFCETDEADADCDITKKDFEMDLYMVKAMERLGDSD